MSKNEQWGVPVEGWRLAADILPEKVEGLCGEVMALRGVLLRVNEGAKDDRAALVALGSTAAELRTAINDLRCSIASIGGAVNECVTLLRGVRAVMEADRAAPVVDLPATQQAALAKAAIERDSLIAAERASLLRAKWDAEADEIATAGHAGLMDEVDALIARRDARLAADDGQAPASQASTIPLRTDGGNLPDVVMTDGTRRKVRRTTLKKHGFSGYQVDHPNGWSSYMTAAELAAFRRVDANGLPAKPGAVDPVEAQAPARPLGLAEQVDRALARSSRKMGTAPVDGLAERGA